MLAAVVGAIELLLIPAGIETDGRECSGEGDVVGLSEGEAVATLMVLVDGGGQVAQVVGIGYLIGRIAYGADGIEDLATEGGAQLRGVAAQD